MAEAPQWVTVGKITSAHGVRGEVKVALFVDDPEFLRDAKFLILESRTQRKRMEIQSMRFHQGQALIRFQGITGRDEAERLRGRELSLPLELLPDLAEDEYYVAEIVGLTVESEEGEVLGEVAEVMFTGANEVYVVRGGPYGEILLPAIESVVQSVALDEGRIRVALPEGLLDEAPTE
ncbi:MAG: ribosome maturation factor RimM [Ardenticatenaceae bacterium]